MYTIILVLNIENILRHFKEKIFFAFTIVSRVTVRNPYDEFITSICFILAFVRAMSFSFTRQM